MIPAGDFPPARRAQSRRARLRGRRRTGAAAARRGPAPATEAWWPGPPPSTVVDPAPDAGPAAAVAWAPAPADHGTAGGARPVTDDRPAPAPLADTAWLRLTREAGDPPAPPDDRAGERSAPRLRPHPAAPVGARPVPAAPAGGPPAVPSLPSGEPRPAAPAPLEPPAAPHPPVPHPVAPRPAGPPAPPVEPLATAPPRPAVPAPAPRPVEPAAVARPAPPDRPAVGPVPPPPPLAPPDGSARPVSPVPPPPWVPGERQREWAPERATGTLTLRPDQAPPTRADDTPPGAAAARSSTRNAVEWVVIIGAALIAALVIKTYLLQAFYIPSPSMVPTLHIQDRVLVNKLSYRLHDVHRGDVVVFERPPNDAGTIRDLIKRVVALPGETVEGRDGVVYVNGRQLNEPYLPKGTVTSQFAPKTIPEGYIWVMGDNRTNSSDSRVFGAVNEDRIVGRAFVRVWPLSAFGLL